MEEQQHFGNEEAGEEFVQARTFIYYEGIRLGEYFEINEYDQEEDLQTDFVFLNGLLIVLTIIVGLYVIMGTFKRISNYREFPI